MKRAICLMMFALAVEFTYADMEHISDDDYKALECLDVLQWRGALSTNDISLVTNCLYSPRDIVKTEALTVAVVHDLSGLKAVLESMLKRRVGPIGYSGMLASAIIEGMDGGLSAVESLRGSNALLRAAGSSNYIDAKEKANHIIAVYVARTYRKGEASKLEWEDLEFSSYDRQLLKYSKLPFETVAREILSELSKASIAGREMCELACVLASYEEHAEDAAIEAFKKDGTGRHGKILLLAYVRKRMSRIGDKGRQRVLSALKGIETDDESVSACLNIVRSYENEK